MKTIVKATFISLLLISVFSISVLADNDVPGEGKNVKVIGKVIDKETGEVLTGVKIMLEGSETAVYSDFDGQFEFESKAAENSQFLVSMISYNSKNIKFGDSNSFTIELERKK